MLVIKLMAPPFLHSHSGRLQSGWLNLPTGSTYPGLPYRQPLYAAYIDLRAAFDSLDRNYLWNIMKTIDIHPNLYDSQNHLFFHPKRSQSEWNTFWGILHLGCVLAANLLNTATERNFNSATEALTLRGRCRHLRRSIQHAERCFVNIQRTIAKTGAHPATQAI